MIRRYTRKVMRMVQGVLTEVEEETVDCTTEDIKAMTEEEREADRAEVNMPSLYRAIAEVMQKKGKVEIIKDGGA